jgi:hypothetical protein
MDERLYDASFTLFAVQNTTFAYRNLCKDPPQKLTSNASRLQNQLSVRPKYEDEEERAKIGGLRDCKWASYHHPNSTRKEAAGNALVLTYDRAVYKFILCSNTNTLSARVVDLPLILVKASAGLTKRVLDFLRTEFQIEIFPLKIPPTLLAFSISTYISSLYSAFSETDSTSTLSLLRETIGTLRLTVSISSGAEGGAEIAQHLRSIDIDVPAETLYQLLDTETASSNATRNPSFLESLQHHIHQKTGLILPLIPKFSQKIPPTNSSSSTNPNPILNQNPNPNTNRARNPSSPSQTNPPNPITNNDEPPPTPLLRLTRLSNLSFALSTEGRLKFAHRAVDAVEGIPGLESGEGNVVRKANGMLLGALIAEAMRGG